MLGFQEKRKVKKVIYSKITLVFLLVLIFFLFNAVWKVYKKQNLTKINLDKTAASLESLQTREKMLSGEIERLKTESGVEEEIRKKYGLVKPGEEVIIIVDDKNTDSYSVSTGSGFWKKFTQWFRR